MMVDLFIGFSPSLVPCKGEASLTLPIIRQVVLPGLSDGSGRRGNPLECVMIKAGGSGVLFTRPSHKIHDPPNPGLRPLRKGLCSPCASSGSGVEVQNVVFIYLPVSSVSSDWCKSCCILTPHQDVPIAL